MNRKRVIFLSILITSFLTVGAVPQQGAQLTESQMKLKRRTNAGVVLKDRGTDI
jgi:hypothetical protein